MADARANLVHVATALRRAGLTDVVFVGGATLEIHITDRAMRVPRVTLDVDIVVDTATRRLFYAIEDRLRAAGFQPDPQGPIGRWRIDHVPVDFTPTAADALGFTNRWYRLLVDTAILVEIAPGVSVRTATAAMYLAAKLEAHRDRGAADPMLSRDLTDVVSLVNGRASLLDDVREMPAEAGEFVRSAVRGLLSDPGFAFVVHAHLPPDDASQDRTSYVLDRLHELTEG